MRRDRGPPTAGCCQLSPTASNGVHANFPDLLKTCGYRTQLPSPEDGAAGRSFFSIRSEAVLASTRRRLGAANLNFHGVFTYLKKGPVSVLETYQPFHE